MFGACSVWCPPVSKCVPGVTDEVGHKIAKSALGTPGMHWQTAIPTVQQVSQVSVSRVHLIQTESRVQKQIKPIQCILNSRSKEIYAHQKSILIRWQHWNKIQVCTELDLTDFVPKLTNFHEVWSSAFLVYLILISIRRHQLRYVLSICSNSSNLGTVIKSHTTSTRLCRNKHRNICAFVHVELLAVIQYSTTTSRF